MVIKQLKIATTISIFLTVMVGCNGLSQHSEFLGDAMSSRNNIVYYLPRRVITILAKQDLTKTAASATDAEKTLDAALKKANADLEAKPDDKDLQKKAQDAAAAAQKDPLPTGSTTTAQLNASINTKTIRDPYKNAGYNLVLDESVISDDHYIIGLDSNGLIASINTDNKDQSVSIVAKTISVIDQFAQVATFTKSLTAANSTATPSHPFSISTYVDPFDGNSLRHAQGVLGSEGIGLRVSYLNGDAIIPTTEVQTRELTAGCDSSVCFRALVPVRITLTYSDLHYRDEEIVLIPDPTQTLRFDVRRGACIDRVTKLTFTDGMLTNVDLTKPSEVLACLDIPLQILKAILSIPADVLTSRTAEINQQYALTTAQLNSLTAQTQLATAQAKAAQLAAAKN